MNAGSASGDAQFLELFSEEAESRLASLGAQLIDLEERGGDQDLLASIFRDAHTLKGSAALLGLDDVTQAAHRMEDVFHQLRIGATSPTAELVDALLHQVDDLRSLVAIATGAPLPTAPHPIESASPSHTVASESADTITRPSPSAATTLRVPTSRIDAMVRLIGEARSAQLRLEALVTRALDADPATVTEFRDLSRVVRDIEDAVMKTRMVPVTTLEPRLRRAVRETARAADKEVRWEMRGEDAEIDRTVLENIADPLLHLVRNAVAHGIESPAERRRLGKPEQGHILLHAMQLGSELLIVVSDDGHGIDVSRVREAAGRHDTGVNSLTDEEALYLIFRSGVSTSARVTDVSGRGVGLDAVRIGVTSIRGRIEVRSTLGAGTEFRIAVPMTVATLRCLIVIAAGQRFAIPMHAVVNVQPPGAHSHVGGGPAVLVGGQAVPITPLDQVLAIDDSTCSGPLVVVAGMTRTHAFQVDTVTGQRDVVVTPMNSLLAPLEAVAGATSEADGGVLLVLNVAGLISRARRNHPRVGHAISPTHEKPVQQDAATILVVDDALTVRELQRSILEDAGYVVRTASDGVEAMALLAEVHTDLVLADVDMPRMDGFELTASIRANPQLTTIPVLLITSRGGEEDRRHGLDIGANGYIVKSAFEQSSLLTAVERLLGRQE